MIEKIDHLGILVKDFDKAVKTFKQAFGLRVESIETLEGGKVRLCFIPLGGIMIELLEDNEPEGRIREMIKDKGEGLNHIAYRVKNIEDAINHMKKNGLTFINETPLAGGSGSRIAFIEPHSVNDVLTELVEKKAE